ncbi:MAG: ribosomal protein L32E [Patescibacteria group bacterium]|jgi:ribosomal protein L32E
MAETPTPVKRKKYRFLRRDWYKKIKFGMGSRKNQKWRAAKGRQNKTRLGRRGYQARPKIGYGADSRIKSTINGMQFTMVEKMSDLESVESGKGILIASIGLKKRKEIIAKANEMKLQVLNKYKETTK